MPIKEINTGTVKSVTVVKKLRDYKNEPFFKKKLEDTKAYLKKYGLLEELTRKK